MADSFVGYLYAKSFLPGDSLEEGYREWFQHSLLVPHKKRIKELRDCFAWRTDASCVHSPVVVVEPVSGEERILIVRFSDAGKDPFGRPQTLRQEAMLVPPSLVPRLWDGTFSAVPDLGTATFTVVFGAPASDFPGLGEGLLINGNHADFDFEDHESSITAEPVRNDSAIKMSSSSSTPHTNPTIRPKRSIGPGEAIKRIKKGDRIMCRVLSVLLILLCILGGWNYFQLTSEIEQLRNRRDAQKDEINGLRKKNGELQREIDKFDTWIRTRSNFEVNKAQLKIKFDEIIKDFREAENLLTHIDETPSPMSADGQSVVVSKPQHVADSSGGNDNVLLPAGNDDDTKTDIVPSESESSRREEKKRLLDSVLDPVRRILP